ncbi:MAG TPA: hypothetical protein VF544_05820 [Pyrinomonadaceae bacterium]
MNHQNQERCSRCRMGRLRFWAELSEEEREVARRLPASAEYSLDERRSTHRWCTNCWHEATTGEPRDV